MTVVIPGDGGDNGGDNGGQLPGIECDDRYDLRSTYG